MSYKFEDLEVWPLALEYTDHVYQIAGQLPDHERFNLAERMKRAANSIALNIAEGSTGLRTCFNLRPSLHSPSTFRGETSTSNLCA
jgi:hypothetical protein